MREKANQTVVAAEPTSKLLEALLDDAALVFVKKLSTNDRGWSWEARITNQAGPYVPPKERDSGFFPPLSAKIREEGEAEIREVFFLTEWPQVRPEKRKTRLVHYTSKGPETHLTRVPKEAFGSLAPASFLVMGRIEPADSEAFYRCLTIDSTSDDVDILSERLSIDPDFFFSEIIQPAQREAAIQERQLTFLELVLKAFRDGQLVSFAAAHAMLPDPAVLAVMARDSFLGKHGMPDLNPFKLDRPGDAVREISRGIEWALFKDFQLKARSLELVNLIVGDDPTSASVEKVITSLVSQYQRIDAILLSASQQRKSRAGSSFESHIEQLLIDGRVPFEKQVVLMALKRPDFILPSLTLFRDKERAKEDVLILSAKTTLRERWKQVQSEMINCDLFLATVDENVAGNAIEEMASIGITLVVPESLKSSKITEYEDHANVIDFKTFFEHEVRAKRMPKWHPAVG